MIKRTLAVLLAAIAMGAAPAGDEAELTRPVVDADVVFEEIDGLVAVEAEEFFEQEKTDKRAWYRTTADRKPQVEPAGDGGDAEAASGGAYVEALPDTRQTHDDKMVVGENFTDKPGEVAVLKYKVHFNKPGRYYVWARIYSTGTEDNGIHAGLDGEWPASGARMQWTEKRKWFWDSKQRTKEVHTGVPGQLFLDIKEPGVHTITFSMREDGVAFDKWLMTTDPEFQRPKDTGPEPKRKASE